MQADLDVPPLPSALFYLWRAFTRMRRRKGFGVSGIEPLGHLDIVAFIQLSGQQLAPWEVAIIEDLDDLLLAAPTEEQ